ncbi:hypothetical protein SC206_05425 [Rouxiella sp. T17]|uniref:T6SS immunity protein Tli3 family protein n=1 Tax=Rouxiella sp. T17 TaxID=3085684 RepID=UPI002FCC5161
MSNKNETSDIRKALKVIGVMAAIFFGIWIIGGLVISMLPTVGGSFGFGFPSGSGGRAIRDVEIDVDPQVVYRIDDHRFFTLEQYLDCHNGGFVYYNDTNKKIKVLADYEGADKRPQNEVSVSKANDTLAFKGRFIYAANDSIIAYPSRDVNYKYGYSKFFIKYIDLNNKNNTTISSEIFIDAIATVTNDAIFIQNSTVSKYSKKFIIPQKNTIDYEWLLSTNINHPIPSKDEYFHCDNKIKPTHIKFINK